MKAAHDQRNRATADVIPVAAVIIRYATLTHIYDSKDCSTVLHKCMLLSRKYFLLRENYTTMCFTPMIRICTPVKQYAHTGSSEIRTPMKRNLQRIVKRAVYIALGIDMNGKKDVLGMYVGENESAKFWLSIMNGLKNRGVEDILIACVDGLNGFPQAIEAVYPKTEIQQCIIHQIRNSTKFVSYKDIKKLMADLKLVYAAPTEETALNELELFKDKWDSKYPKIYKSWHDNWATLSTYFKYPEAVRRLIYTTNAIEGFNRQLRKVTKSKTVFPSDDSLLKMLYLATMDITKKWTGHRQDWGQIHFQLEIYFEERLIGHNL